MKRFAGKVAIITGAAQGLGKEIARIMISEGAKVVIDDIEADTLEATAKEFEGLGEFVPIAADVSQEEDAQKIIDLAVEKYEKIDIVFNNAGAMTRGNFMDVDAAQLEYAFANNVKGIFLVGQAAAKVMIEKGIKGAIVNTASIASDYITPNTVSYAASKGAVKQLTKVMAADLAVHGIRVNCFGPGFMATRMIQGTLDDPERLKTILAKIPMGRPGQPAEMARVAAFLASDDASYMTGSHVLVDGGWSIF